MPLDGVEIFKTGAMLSSITVFTIEFGTSLLSVTSITKSTLFEVTSSGTFIESVFVTGISSVLPITSTVTSERLGADSVDLCPSK